MRKLILILSSILFVYTTDAQIDFDNQDIPKAYQKFLPSNAQPNDLRPSDIPSEQVLRQMGLSNMQVEEAINFKYSRGKYSNPDTSLSQASNISMFYESLGDTLKKDSVSYPKARIYGQDIFRNNNLQFFQKALDAKAPEHYKVSSGDEISISVWGYSEFSETLIVDERGYINPSSYGRIYVKGLTFKKMRSLLKNRFSSFLDMKNSEIDVTLSYSRVITINIVGEVYRPGSYTIPAINTAFNALLAAKGPNQLGTVRNIYVKRDGKLVDSLDIYKFLFNPTRSQDIYLRDGDYLFVPPAKNIVEVKGAVNRPYTYEAKTGESVEDIIQYAGGYTSDAFLDVLTLKRVDYNTKKVNDIHKKDLRSTILKNGDEIVVNNISNTLSNVVQVKGSVGVTGDYEFIEGERLLDILKRAKCITEHTFLDQVYVIRLNKDRTKSHITVNLLALEDANHEDNILLQEYDIITVLALDDFDDFFSVRVVGAVRQPGEFDFGVGLTLRDVLLQAGGLTQQAEDSRIEISRVMNYDVALNKLNPKRALVKTICLEDGLKLTSDANQFELQPFDQVFVRSNPNFEPSRNIVLKGEVKYPGTYTLLNKNERISSVIKRAGGLTKYAYADGAKMFRVFHDKGNNNVAPLVISNLLKDSLMNNPELAILYREELLKAKEESLMRLYSSSISRYDLVYLNLNKALNSNISKHNLVLHEGDSIVIPKTMDVVHIEGDLMNLETNSISAPYFSNRRASFYVNNFAGGFTNDNARNKTVVVYPNGIAKRSLGFKWIYISPKVKKGATIKVTNKVKKDKNKNIPIDWNEAIDKTMLKVTGILTLWLLIDRVADAASSQ